jgi:hypothetical protein
MSENIGDANLESGTPGPESSETNMHLMNESNATLVNQNTKDIDLLHNLHAISHLSIPLLVRLLRKSHVLGLQLTSTCDYSHIDKNCVVCARAKLRRRAFLKKRHRRPSKELFTVIDTDISGPVEIAGINGEHYVISFIDTYGKRKSVYCLRGKSSAEVAEVFETFIISELLPILQHHKRTSGVILRFNRLHSDCGNEYLGELEKVCTKYGISYDTTTPYTPEQNSICESYWRPLWNTARAMLFSAGLNMRLWPFAILYANYVLNRTLLVSGTVRIDGVEQQKIMTPEEWTWGSKPDISNLQPWGNPAELFVNKHLRTKLGQHSVRGYFMGFHNNAVESPLFYIEGLQPSNCIVASESIQWVKDLSPKQPTTDQLQQLDLIPTLLPTPLPTPPASNHQLKSAEINRNATQLSCADATNFRAALD